MATSEISPSETLPPSIAIRARQSVQQSWSALQALTGEIRLQLGRRLMYRLLSRRHETSLRRFRQWREKLSGTTILCVGNGPSLREVDPDQLDRFPALLTNHAARALPRRPAQLLGTVMTDDYRVLEATPLLPTWARPLILSSHISTEGLMCSAAARIVRKAEFALRPVVDWVDGNWQLPGLRKIVMGNYNPGFETDLSRGLWLNRSVIFSTMQIACYLGARRIVLIGVEMDYQGAHKHCVPNVKEIVPNFSYEREARPSFLLAKEACDKLGVEVVNATPGGRVDVFPRTSLAELKV